MASYPGPVSRTSSLITILIFAALVAGVWLYQSGREEKISPWDLISGDAAVVVEISNYQAFVKNCSALPFLDAAIDEHKGLRLLSTVNPKASEITVSLHAISADDFAITIIVSSASIDLPAVEGYHQDKAVASTRTYNGTIITEYKYPDGKSVSITGLDDLTLISTSSILIESAIRLLNARNANVFRTENARLFQLPSLQSDHGNIYINSANLNKLLGLLTQSGRADDGHHRLGDGALVDLKLDSTRVLLNGFVTDMEAPGLIGSFAEQQPTSSEIWSYISNRSALVLEGKFSNPEKWYGNSGNALAQLWPGQFKNLEQQFKIYSVDLSKMRALMGAHVTTCYVARGTDLGSVSFIKYEGDASILKEVAFRVAEHKGDSVYHEYHRENEIQMIDMPDLFFAVAYPLLPRSARTFFTMVDGYLAVSEDVDLIKVFLDDIAQEDTWGKSVEWSRYLRTTLQESNINLYFDGRLTSLLLREVLNDKWRPFVDTTKLLGIEKGAIQVSHLDAVYYVNSVLSFELQRPPAIVNQVTTRYQFDRGLRRSPVVVENHETKGWELLVQDSLNNLQLFSSDLKKRWSVSLGSAIRDRIAQIDYYKNGKLQYLLATDKEMYLIDRLGRPVEKFPVKLPVTEVEFLRVVDYDNRRNYRYLLVDKKGNAFLTDKDGNALEGWNPRSVGSGLMNAPSHRRVYGKDYFVAVQSNGIVHLMNRRGAPIAGFPVTLSARPQGAFAVQHGKDLASSYLVLVSEDGQKIQVDFKGEVTRSDVLPRLTHNARFVLVNAVGSDAFVFFRIEGARLAVIDAKGTLLFETQNTGSDQWELQFVQTSLKQSVFCLFDKQQNFSYLFNESGKPLMNSPLESDWMPTLKYDQNMRLLHVYNVLGNSISAIPINLE